MSRMVKFDYLIEKAKNDPSTKNNSSFFKSLHTVDAVEVVRCEKCLKWQELGGQLKNCSPTPLRGNCLEWFEVTEANDFCSYGEPGT